MATGTAALTAESLGVKLTAVGSVAPRYPTRHGRLDDDDRSHAGR